MNEVTMIYSYYKKLGEMVSDEKWFFTDIIKEGQPGIEVVLSDPSVFRSIDKNKIEEIRKKLSSIKVSTHLPFYDLNYSSPDPYISKYSSDVLVEALEVSANLGASISVAHINLNTHLPEKAFNKWFKGFIKAKQNIEQAGADFGIIVAWENTYEKDFKVFDMVKNESPDTFFCLDAGHCNCFSEFSPSDFIERYGNSIKHLHLHDNRGEEDSHLVPGKGTLDFSFLISKINLADIETTVFEIGEEDLSRNIDDIKIILKMED
jgi:sugar phosphate isomerase/epimerase